ncbi:hypothetical protein [Alkalimarinus sediminis]|uniref:Uncharacterized protein n=1 Tax=Alkalimarinus sediminis TaxID=1632866 RepID=A0A9E8KQ53_9ALTE|nr:hypothetical protein [Alkalimarinus sediminis]UZW74840.1 hypothetical protein NNL22_17750 [Alkalimarinus sediminis]
MKPFSIFAKTLGVGLLVSLFYMPISQTQASGVSQMPGAQQQRGIDNDRRRQQKELQLQALEEKKKRQQEENSKSTKPLVVVPEEMQAPAEGENKPKE